MSPDNARCFVLPQILKALDCTLFQKHIRSVCKTDLRSQTQMLSRWPSQQWPSSSLTFLPCKQTDHFASPFQGENATSVTPPRRRSPAFSKLLSTMRARLEEVRPHTQATSVTDSGPWVFTQSDTQVWKWHFKMQTNVCFFFYNSFQSMSENGVMGRVKTFYTFCVMVHTCAGLGVCACVRFQASSNLSG